MPKSDMIEAKSAVKQASETAPTVQDLVTIAEGTLNRIFEVVSTSQIDAEKKLNAANRYESSKPN